MVHLSRGQQRIVPVPKVEQLEFVRRGRFVLGHLDIDAPHPVPLSLQPLNQMMPDESSGASDKYACLSSHE